ncbi:sensor histidine kinase [Clostridium sp.]|jgi:signal transduction histidine kinase|uniref:sensor histidine kinase n=1 Tax=Clostridium sp. TaxID=1506 RepID=UPI003A5BA02E
MSKITYLKNSLSKIVYFICIFSVVNLVLISSKPINLAKNDIIYMDFLIVFISLIFAIYDYKKWNYNYKDIAKAIKNGNSVDEYMPNSNTSFEINIIKDILRAKNSEIENKVDKIKSLLDEVNDYITKWIHEIKIPIAVCELIADRIEEASEIEYINNISQELRVEIERIKFLINQVLYTSRSSSYSEDLQIREVNIEKIIRDILKRNSIFFISKNIELELQNVSFNVMTDEKWTRYIIDQIINNACKYVETSGKITISADEDEKMVRLFIRDNGIGISQKDIKRIFDKGFTGENGRKVSKSTGMGLYLSKKMANKMNHNLLVKSEEGVYTEFILCFYKLSDYFKVT